MPVRAKSLAITDAYRNRMTAARSQAQIEAERLWPDIRGVTGSKWPELMVKLVTTRQREVVEATAAYLTAFLSSELGRPATPIEIDADRYAGLTRSGRPLAERYDAPIITILTELKAGRHYSEALNLGLVRGKRMVGIDIDHARRQALLDAIAEHPAFRGWKRAVAGTCGACAAAASETTSGELHFEVHPSCNCVSEPEVDPQAVQSGLSDRPSTQAEVVEMREPPDPEVFRQVEGAAEQLARALPGADRVDELIYGTLDSRETAAYFPGTRRIVLTEKVSAEEAPALFAHEYGHFLDLGMGVEKVQKMPFLQDWKWEPERIAEQGWYKFLGAEEQALKARQELLRTLWDTDAYKGLTRVLEEEVPKISMTGGGRFVAQSEVEYLAQPAEMVARAFTQMMGEAAESGSALGKAWKIHKKAWDAGGLMGKEHAIFTAGDMKKLRGPLKAYLKAKGIYD